MDGHKPSPAPYGGLYKRAPSLHRLQVALCSSLLLTFGLILYASPSLLRSSSSVRLSRPPHAENILAVCSQLHALPGPPQDFYDRKQSDRFETGTRPVLVRNARIWTGKKNGTEVLDGMDILLDGGIIQSIGHLGHLVDSSVKLLNLDIVDAEGRWVTPGIVDLHSHMGPESAPALEGADDGNSGKGNVQPWLRILDGLNTHDDSYRLSSAGGVTTSLILPGSANAIGGQAIVIKLRPTSERSSSAMVLEPPHTINTSFPDPSLPLRWRHMKHACGENPSGMYQGTRMDTFWDFRQGYNTAKKIKDAQDAFCVRALNEDWKDLGEFPQDIQWEALVDVLRGRVKVNTHCYEAVDLDAFVRLSNEFKFPVAAFHHASEAYLVPDRIKQAYGKPPAIALFAVYGGYKRESYRASEYAPRILAEHNLTVLLKSDHPSAVNSRYLLYEAQQAYFYGFPENLAIASVTSNAADALGMGHRIGYIQQGYDADLVVWDSHPLALGATPVQVFIDGIPQLHEPSVLHKPESFQSAPKVPNFDEEARKAVEYDGLPDLSIHKDLSKTDAVFTNVKSVYTAETSGALQEVHPSAVGRGANATVVVRRGVIVCYGSGDACAGYTDAVGDTSVIDLEGGSISPGLVSYGCNLGHGEIHLESSTTDGDIYDLLTGKPPHIIGGEDTVVFGVDGLNFGTRHALQAYRAGVTLGVSSPTNLESFLMIKGVGVAFSLGAGNKLEEGAVLQDAVGLHVSLRHAGAGAPSISTQIATLRRLLLRRSSSSGLATWFGLVRYGDIPLVVEVHSADIIASLLLLKKEVEAVSPTPMHLTITGASEAHLLAKELAEANVGVILTPPRPFPHTWDERRILPGPPLSNNSAVVELVENGVVVGLGCEGMWSAGARNLPFDLGWAALESGGRLSKAQALALGSTNVMKLLGVEVKEGNMDMVASRGGELMEFGSKVVAVFSGRDGKVRVL